MTNNRRDKKAKPPDQHSALKRGVTYEHEDEEQIISHLQEKMEKSRKEIKGILKKL